VLRADAGQSFQQITEAAAADIQPVPVLQDQLPGAASDWYYFGDGVEIDKCAAGDAEETGGASMLAVRRSSSALSEGSIQ
jgi:hypothetical protein